MRSFLKILITVFASAAALAALVGCFYLYTTKAAGEDKLKPQNYVNEPKERKVITGDTDFPIKKTEITKTGSHFIEGIDMIWQMPELPTGCEVTSLTMVLRSLGTEADKVDISRRFLSKADVTCDENDNYYGPNFTYIFAGDPEGDSSYGCMAPCIVRAAQRFIEEYGYELSPISLVGSDFNELLNYVEHDVPVIIWSTMWLVEPEYKVTWTTPEGKKMEWPSNEHCVVLTGYDADAGTVQIHDPMNGVVTCDINEICTRYEQLGQNAVIVIENK